MKANVTRKQRDEECLTMYLAAAVIRGICNSRIENSICFNCPFRPMCGTEPYTWEIPGEGSQKQ